MIVVFLYEHLSLNSSPATPLAFVDLNGLPVDFKVTLG